jgi:hypothetical protein
MEGMMTDLTKVNVPFGLLDEETQTALREHPGPIEVWSGFGGWEQHVPPELHAMARRGDTQAARLLRFRC